MCVVGGVHVEAAFSRRFALKKGCVPVAIHACALVVGELGSQVRVRGGGVPGGVLVGWSMWEGCESRRWGPGMRGWRWGCQGGRAEV